MDMDVLLNNVLTDYKNPELKDDAGNIVTVDTSKGTLIFIKAAGLASALWGLHKRIDWLKDQIFPDTADTPNLEHHAADWGITRLSGEDDTSLAARVLNRIQNPPAGGTDNDYEQWALSVSITVDDVTERVVTAKCTSCALGTGTVGVCITSSATGGTPSDALIEAVQTYIDSVRPTTVKIVSIVGPTAKVTNITMTVKCSKSLDDDEEAEFLADIKSNITTYIAGLDPGEGLSLSRIASLAFETGNVTAASMSLPTADVTCDWDEKITAGTINVSLA